MHNARIPKINPKANASLDVPTCSLASDVGVTFSGFEYVVLQSKLFQNKNKK